MLNVGVAFTKDDTIGIGLCHAFIEGIIKSGDNPVSIRHPTDLLGANFDCIVQVCDYTKHNGKDLRWYIRDYCQTWCVPRLVMDTGFITSLNERENKFALTDSRYVAVGEDGIKRDANYYNENSPPDRWEKLNIELKPWRKNGDHILVLGQHEKGVSVQDVDIVKWMTDTIFSLNKLTSRPVKLRLHPNQTILPQGNYTISNPKKNTTIVEDLENCWCVVAYTTNGAVDAILNGIPVVCCSPKNITYNISGTLIYSVAKPYLSIGREQWCYNLAYAQWNVAEIREGLPWQHFRKNLWKEKCQQ